MSGGDFIIINMTGTILSGKKIQEYQHIELLDGFKAGTYILMAKYNKKIYKQKIIIF